ncbi:TPA: heavy-metal-associated domain-containing protein [Streptococcus suis]|nr:heavy-metal-associated domain-containing protein [Streptococcus suis]HEL2326689.1 heavy-metal-associated domain-containing protein [Streptococcus suis]HEM2652487.1 heavy-metal-associated domain-containing protein [Streptococcus suis]
MKISIYNVNGMTCATCTLTVEKAIGKVARVSKATVNLATEKVTVEYDEQEVGMKDLQMAVEKAGYELENPYQS